MNHTEFEFKALQKENAKLRAALKAEQQYHTAWVVERAPILAETDRKMGVAQSRIAELEEQVTIGQEMLGRMMGETATMRDAMLLEIERLKRASFWLAGY
jgi:hypothetical protein